MDERRFVALYRGGDRPVGASGMNAAKHLMRAKGLREASAGWQDVSAAFAEAAPATSTR